MLKIKILLSFFLFFTLNLGLAQTTIKSRLLKSQVGDFVVMEQGSTYSIVLVRYLDSSLLVLEEISVDQTQIDLKKISWPEWIKNRAPGAESWTSLVIDLNKNTLTHCYSHLDNQWLFIEKSDYFLRCLFELIFRPTKEEERKKIGPAPILGEPDRRKLWKPQLTRDGKTYDPAEYEVLRATWPADKTRVSGCVIEMYLDANHPQFPFPYWMEVQSPHYTFKMRAIDSGGGINSPVRLLKLK